MEKIIKTSLLVNEGKSIETVFEYIRDSFFHYPALVKCEPSFGDPDLQRLILTFQFDTEAVDVLELLQKLHQIKEDLFIVSIEP
ncbi:MAG: hypothetical protein P4N59_30265 [Negativicutes bacterium]|nr:hypothetical protein [Negativicutes bacterium]